jgi:hypothetical protein
MPIILPLYTYILGEKTHPSTQTRIEINLNDWINKTHQKQTGNKNVIAIILVFERLKNIFLFFSTVPIKY